MMTVVSSPLQLRLESPILSLGISSAIRRAGHHRPFALQLGQIGFGGRIVRSRVEEVARPAIPIITIRIVFIESCFVGISFCLRSAFRSFPHQVLQHHLSSAA
jgi:hypothetical protein